ncbi:MAG: hypothetical protein MK193_08360 [Lentisphaeria bacterium]|nr:hypothetical protein [Lentisphaeria bacterium]
MKKIILSLGFLLCINSWAGTWEGEGNWEETEKWKPNQLPAEYERILVESGELILNEGTKLTGGLNIIAKNKSAILRINKNASISNAKEKIALTASGGRSTELIISGQLLSAQDIFIHSNKSKTLLDLCGGYLNCAGRLSISGKFAENAVDALRLSDQAVANIASLRGNQLKHARIQIDNSKLYLGRMILYRSYVVFSVNRNSELWLQNPSYKQRSKWEVQLNDGGKLIVKGQLTISSLSSKLRGILKVGKSAAMNDNIKVTYKKYNDQQYTVFTTK